MSSTSSSIGVGGNSNTNIYSRYRLPSTTTSLNSTNSSLLMDDHITVDHKRSYTIESLNTLAYFNSSDNELTPSAAIRDRYYQSSRYLSDNDLLDEEDVIYEEEKIDGDVLDYRPGDSACYSKPDSTPSIYSVSNSVISLRTEYNDDARSIASTRTVDDRMQGRSSSTIANLAQKTAKKVSRSSSIFRAAGINTDKKEKRNYNLLYPLEMYYQNLLWITQVSEPRVEQAYYLNYQGPLHP